MRYIFSILLVVLLVAVPVGGAWALTLEDVEDALSRSDADWTAEDNDAADLHFNRGWYTPNTRWPILTGAEQIYSPPFKATLPNHLDWREVEGQNWITPVRNQASCGSCWAFGATAAIEAHMAYYDRTPDPMIDLAEQQLLSCSFNLGCSGGGFTNVALNYARDKGLADEACFPYQEQKLNCGGKCADWRTRVRKIDSWQLVSLLPNVRKIKDALQNGPVASSFIVYQDFYYYSQGIYTHTTGGMVGMHAISIVGYDAAERYWICKNSWGGSWGESGYFRIKFGSALIGAYTALPVYNPQPAVAAR
jgi:C1A family cysteine protease